MKYINNVIHTENKIDLNNFIYTEIYAFSDAIPEVNGTFVNMAAGSSIEILIKSISLTPNVYLIGKGRINSPSIINKGKFKPFTFLIKSDNAGSSDNNQFTIPINKNYGYSYTIDTSDGQKYANVTDNKTITFPSAGTYSIEISSNFPSIYFNNEGDKDKLIDITQWGEIEWLSMVNSFYGCANLTNITAIDVPILTRFKSHPIKYDNTFYDSNIRGFYQTFMNCTNLTNINFIYSWEISQVRVFTAMFRGCNSVNDWEGIINWKFGEFSELHFLFFLSSFDDTAMTYVSNWDVSNVVSFTGTFFGTTITSVTPITNWDVSNVESFSAMFYLTQLTSLIPITNWDVSNATDLSFMFYGTQLLSLEGLEIWDTSNVTDISQFIYGTEVTSLIPLTNWDTSSVTRMGQLFRNLQITSLEGVENWDTSSVTYMEVLIVETPLLTSLIPLTNWDVSNVTELSFSFNDLNNLINSEGLENWDVSSVTRMVQVFKNSSSFNGDIGNWDVSNVTNMLNFFEGATNFDHSLSKWNINKVGNFNGFLDNGKLSTVNYDDTLIGWELTLQSEFPDGLGYTPNIIINFGTSQYTLGSNAEIARQSLITNYGWSINDSGGL